MTSKQDVNNRGSGMRGVWKKGDIWELSVLSDQFSVNLKIF